MALKTLVKVGKVSNLSDARYCAGMGVDMLGFCVTPGQPSFISLDAFKEIRGWFTGPLIIAEAYGTVSKTDLDTIVQNYHPDYLEFSIAEFSYYSTNLVNCILFLTQEDWNTNQTEILKRKSQIGFVLVHSSENQNFLNELAKHFKVLVKVDSQTLESVIANHSISGIALEGSAEERPGLKSYDQLAEILEKLEVE